MTKDRSMATGPYPVRVVARRVTVQGAWCAGAYRSRTVGQRGMVILSDDSEVACCAGPRGHKDKAALLACVQRRVDALNESAGIPSIVR